MAYGACNTCGCAIEECECPSHSFDHYYDHNHANNARGHMSENRAKLLLDQLKEGLVKAYAEDAPGRINFDYGDYTTRVDDHTLEIPTDEGTFVVTIKLKEGAALRKWEGG